MLTGKDLIEGTFDPEDMNAIVFFHGKESGPFGSKYRELTGHYNVLSPDFTGMDFEDRLLVALDVTEGMEDVVLVGSSFGGLLAAVLYSRVPERFRGYVLLAPALHLPEAEGIDKVPNLATVIHGEDDEVVPILASQHFCSKWGVKLVQVQDGHRLKGSVPQMLEEVRLLTEESNAG